MMSFDRNEKYIYAVYAMSDSERVRRIIELLEKRGFRIAHDTGIVCGSEFTESIADDICHSEVVLVFASPAALKSFFVKNEIKFALSEHKRLLIVNLEDTEFPAELRMRLDWAQSVSRKLYASDKEFVEALENIPALCECRRNADDICMCCPSASSVQQNRDPERSVQPTMTYQRMKRSSRMTASGKSLIGTIAGGIGSLFSRKSKKNGQPSVPVKSPEPVSYSSQPFMSASEECYSSNFGAAIDSDPFSKASDSPDAPVPRISEVQFSAVVPKKAERSEYIPINIVMYEEEFRNKVDELLEENTKEASGGIHRVAENSKVKVVLSSKDVEIEDDVEERIWFGKYQTFDFDVPVPEDYAKKQILFRAGVYINDLHVTNLKFIVDVACAQEQKAKIDREDIKSAFVSYAKKDYLRVVSIVQGMKKISPDMDIFVDVESLRSGDDWQEALKTEIDRHTVLYLCWSKYASESKWVDFEWRYAFEKKGAEGIEPVPIGLTEECPPPTELSGKHFGDSRNYIIKALETVKKGNAYIVRKGNGDIIHINKNSFTLGREKAMVDCVVDNSRISRRHAEFIREEDGYFIMDAGSANKTYVNGVLCEAWQKIPLEHGDVILLADEVFGFEVG